MSSPKEPFAGELETDVQRTATLLDEAYKATEAGEAPRHDKVVILRALVLSVQAKLVPPSAVDALLDPNGLGAFVVTCFAKDAPAEGLRLFAGRPARPGEYP